jgi:hypothetical protein
MLRPARRRRSGRAPRRAVRGRLLRGRGLSRAADASGDPTMQVASVRIGTGESGSRCRSCTKEASAGSPRTNAGSRRTTRFNLGRRHCFPLTRRYLVEDDTEKPRARRRSPRRFAGSRRQQRHRARRREASGPLVIVSRKGRDARVRLWSGRSDSCHLAYPTKPRPDRSHSRRALETLVQVTMQAALTVLACKHHLERARAALAVGDSCSSSRTVQQPGWFAL